MRSERIDRRLVRDSPAARRQFAVAGVLGALSAGVIVAQAALLARIISAAAMRHASLAHVRSQLIALAAVLIARAVLAGSFEFSGRLASVRVLADLRQRLARRLLVERPGLGPRERTGELAAAAVQGVDSLDSYFAGYLPSLVLACVVPVVVLAWIVPVDAITAVILAVTIPVLIIFMILIGIGAGARTRSRWEALSLLSSHFLDVVRGLETLRAHRRERAQAVTLTEVGERYRAETMGTLRLAFISSLVLELCAMLGTALVAATIGVQLTGGHLTLYAGLTVLLLAPELYNPLRQVGQQFHASADGLAAAGRLLEVLDSPAPLSRSARPSETDDISLEPSDPAGRPLHLDGVSFSYPGRPGSVLKGVTVTVSAGECVAITGPSGAGKSTLAALLLRLIDPSVGVVRCGPTDLRDVPAAQWRRQVAWVPQRATLFAATIAENIALARPEAPAESVAAAARAADLSELIASLTDGLETVVGEGGRQLSAGQRQRIALARAFLTDAPLVVLDEPTANLDAETAAAVGVSIARLAAGRTTVLLTHDQVLARRAGRVLELRDGSIVIPAKGVEAAA